VFPEFEDCYPICGDSYWVPTEECDNGNLIGCIDCTIDADYECIENELYQESYCSWKCGNGVRNDDEICDDGN